MRELFKKSAVLSLMFGLVLASAPVQAANVIVENSADSIQLWMGEQTGLHIGVTCGAEQKIEFPHFVDTVVAGLEIVPPEKLDTQYLDKGKRMTVTKTWTVTSFEEKQYFLPPFIVNVDGQEYSADNGIALAVSMFEVDTLHTDQFFGPKENMAMKIGWKDLRLPLLWLVLFLLLGVLAVYIFISWKDNKPIIRIIKVEPKKPAHEVALSEIEHIREQQLAHGSDPKHYYTLLTDAVRVYLNDRFGFNATEMTSDEIIEKLLEQKDRESIADLKELLMTADLVKFAKFTPMLGENDRNLVTAMEFVKETMLQEDPAAQQPKEEVVVEQKRSKGVRIALLCCWIVAGLASAFFLYELVIKIYYLFF